MEISRLCGPRASWHKAHPRSPAPLFCPSFTPAATNVDAVVYLMLANELVHELLPDAITIAEDVSGAHS